MQVLLFWCVVFLPTMEFRKLGQELTRTYKEIIDGFNAGLLILCDR
jgi:hypothetical protein